MVCMSSSVTSHVIDNISNDYDAAVVSWKDELSRNVQVAEAIEILCSSGICIVR